MGPGASMEWRLLYGMCAPLTVAASHTGVAQAGLRPPPTSTRHSRQVPGVVGRRGWVQRVGTCGGQGRNR